MILRLVRMIMFAPHRRGSTSLLMPQNHRHNVCPAQAGVYPSAGKPGRGRSCLPRTGGGLPFSDFLAHFLAKFAPHRRGSTSD